MVKNHRHRWGGKGNIPHRHECTRTSHTVGAIQLCVHLKITDNIESKKLGGWWTLGKTVMILGGFGGGG